MKRAFAVVICAFASAALAQSGRARRADAPKEQSARKAEAKDEASGGSKERAHDDGVARNEGDANALTGKEVTVRAVIKSRPEPGYPREARRYNVEGAVKLRIILGADGRVRDEIDVLESLPHGVTDEAIKAARKIEFEPARKNGRPVSQYVTVIYHFKVH